MFAPNLSNNNNSSCGDFIKSWWKNVPYFNRAICFVCISLYLISFIFTEVSDYGVALKFINLI